MSKDGVSFAKGRGHGKGKEQNARPKETRVMEGRNYILAFKRPPAA
jgi:hypothetical protein